jgi:proteasome lid subunit RPN8/RPN11
MNPKSRASLLLSTSSWKTILLDAYGRQKIEACGALLGRMDEEGNWYVEEVYPLRNTYASPVYFEFDPAELLTIDLEQPGRMIGVYHSHPTGPAIASSTDRENMRRVNVEQQIPWVWLIVSGPFSTIPVSDSEEATISVGGVVAYYHYQKTGLQKIAIRHHGEENFRGTS